jgi:hypothetical protein
MVILESGISLIKGWYNKLSDEEKKQFVLICTAVFSALLILSVIIYVRRGVDREELHIEPERVRLNVAIPAENLFLPDEPDFIPGVLLERERLSRWTEEGAAGYWQNPLVSGEEQWRRKIEITIYEFLEHIP